MARKSKVIKRNAKISRADEAKLAALEKEFRGLIDKVGFLVRRSEFLQQQGLLFNAQASELLRDKQDAKTLAHELEARWEDLNMKMSGQKRRVVKR